MKVSIKTFDVEMPIKTNGIELEVRTVDGKQQLGDCYVTVTGLTWCKGRIVKDNGVLLSWKDLMEICRSDETLKVALKATKAVP